jgi:6,7-dimethyl-8-ribityllumazine synthase
MIKGITSISAVASDAEFDRINSLFSALGFEHGKGWNDSGGRGAAFLAPIGNLEFITGRLPSTSS